MKNCILLVLALFSCFFSVVYAGSAITRSDIYHAQAQWGNGIVAIGKAYTHHKNYIRVAQELIDHLYAYNYENGVVLFKPTKAKNAPFRPTKSSALSYFVGNAKAKYAEDKGFALQPWVRVVFHNDEIYYHDDVAIAMGEYYFTPRGSTSAVKVEYTLGYVKDKQGQLKIFLHHSSMPYSG